MSERCRCGIEGWACGGLAAFKGARFKQQTIGVHDSRRQSSMSPQFSRYSREA